MLKFVKKRLNFLTGSKTTGLSKLLTIRKKAVNVIK